MPGAEPIQNPLALGLGDVAVNRLGDVPEPVQVLRHHVGVAAGPHEDDRRVGLLEVEDASQSLRLAVMRDLVIDLANPRRDGLAGFQADAFGIAQVLAREALDAGRDRG